MNKKLSMFLASLTVLTLGVGMAACGKDDGIDDNDVVTRTDYTSVYSKIGSQISVDMVKEAEDGTATVEYEGKEYELGMDFLSMAMVYNMKTSDKYPTKDDVYNQWWKLYIQRWNMLVPEVPLYSNQYYDVYNGKIDNLETTPYWGVPDAIIKSKVTDGSDKVILGSITDLSGLFRVAAFGKSVAGGADLDIQNLTNGYATVVTDKEGALQWAGTDILKSHEEVMNDDGTLTVTLEIADDLTFSDGSPITAKNYVANVIAGSTPVYGAASGGSSAGMMYSGYNAFNVYDGTNAGQDVDGVKASNVFSGVRILNDYKFSVNIVEDYADYYYSTYYSVFSPMPLKLYLGEYTIKDDGNGCYIDGDFYKKETKNGLDVYTMADVITANMNNFNAADIPYSGPYIVSSYDASSKTATLTRNTKYKGDHRGNASIGTIAYTKIVSETQLDQLKLGTVDVLSGITGGDETKAALAVVDGTKFKETHYDRAGYGKLAFRCDFGATQFTEVRQAVMYTINRTEFANTFTGGYGSVVDGPYYTGSAAYQANRDTIKLNKYNYSVESAVSVLEKGGWIYDAKGGEYKSGIRYKKLEGYELTYNNLHFASKDNKYKTVKAGDSYYMPLVINWMGTRPNTVTDLLVTSWQTSKTATSDIGMYITYASGDFNLAIYGEYGQDPSYGYSGKAVYGAVNYATGFNSALYDYSFNWTLDPAMYANYNINYLMDEADFWANY